MSLAAIYLMRVLDVLVHAGASYDDARDAAELRRMHAEAMGALEAARSSLSVFGEVERANLREHVERATSVIIDHFCRCLSTLSGPIVLDSGEE